MSADPLEMMEAYQRTAVVAASVRTGIADALAAGPLTAVQVAGACGTEPRATQALLGALIALGLAEREGGGAQGRVRLSESGAPLASSHPQSAAQIVAKEWFFYNAWSGLDQSIRDGHARIGPWRERLAGDPAQSLDFLRALDDLAERFGGELPELAGPVAGSLLDVGGGAGSHAARLVTANPGLAATVLDLEDVRDLLAERHPSLDFHAGDLHAPRFGRPEHEHWDNLLLANILHDQPPGQAQEIVRQARELLAPGGTLLLYEWVLDESRDAPAPVAMFALMMIVENEGAAAYTYSEIDSWLDEAGFQDRERRSGHGPISVVRAVAPR